jgi:hypothetical protein
MRVSNGRERYEEEWLDRLCQKRVKAALKWIRAAAKSRVIASTSSDAVKPPLAVRPSDLTLLLSV